MNATLSVNDWRQTLPPREFIERAAPLIDTEEVPLCCVCESGRFEPFALGFDFELLTCRNPWRFVRCTECGHVWLNPRPPASMLPVIYPPTYYAYNYAEQVPFIARWSKEQLDRLKFRSILKFLGREPRSFLDIGCGDGRFLRAMERRGLARENVWGLELDERVVANLAGTGFRVLCRRAEECEEIPRGSIDLATIFHVIEHVADPAAVVRKTAEWLSPGGCFAIETPNLDSCDARWFQSRWWGGYHVPRHWHMFTAKTLGRLVESAGLEVAATVYQTGHSFWMYSLHHYFRYGDPPRPWLGKWFDPLKGLPFLAAFTAFDKVRAGLGWPTSTVLVVARKPVR